MFDLILARLVQCSANYYFRLNVYECVPLPDSLMKMLYNSSTPFSVNITQANDHSVVLN